MREPDVIVFGGPERAARPGLPRAVRIALAVLLAALAGGWLVLFHPTGEPTVALPSAAPSRPPPSGVALAPSGGYAVHWDGVERTFTAAFEVTNLAVDPIRVTGVEVGAPACLPGAIAALVPTPQDSMSVDIADRLVPVTVPLVLRQGAAATVFFRCRVDCLAARLAGKDGDRVTLLLAGVPEGISPRDTALTRYQIGRPPQLSRLADQACSEPDT